MKKTYLSQNEFNELDRNNVKEGQRYPPAQGRGVWTLAMETWGHLGNEAEETLTTLAAEATRHARRHGHVVTAGSFIRRWRASLDASLQRGVAAALLAARCGLPGTSHRKRWRARGWWAPRSGSSLARNIPCTYRPAVDATTTYHAPIEFNTCWYKTNQIDIHLCKTNDILCKRIRHVLSRYKRL